jgi:hypothetical protein
MKWIGVSGDEDVTQSHKQKWTCSCIYSSDVFLPSPVLFFSLFTDVTGELGVSLFNHPKVENSDI